MKPEHAGDFVPRDCRRREVARRRRIRLGRRGGRQRSRGVGFERGWIRLLPLRLGSPVEEPAAGFQHQIGFHNHSQVRRRSQARNYFKIRRAELGSLIGLLFMSPPSLASVQMATGNVFRPKAENNFESAFSVKQPHPRSLLSFFPSLSPLPALEDEAALVVVNTDEAVRPSHAEHAVHPEPARQPPLHAAVGHAVPATTINRLEEVHGRMEKYTFKRIHAYIACPSDLYSP